MKLLVDEGLGPGVNHLSRWRRPFFILIVLSSHGSLQASLVRVTQGSPHDSSQYLVKFWINFEKNPTHGFTAEGLDGVDPHKVSHDVRVNVNNAIAYTGRNALAVPRNVFTKRRYLESSRFSDKPFASGEMFSNAVSDTATVQLEILPSN